MGGPQHHITPNRGGPQIPHKSDNWYENWYDFYITSHSRIKSDWFKRVSRICWNVNPLSLHYPMEDKIYKSLLYHVPAIWENGT